MPVRQRRGDDFGPGDRHRAGNWLGSGHRRRLPGPEPFARRGGGNHSAADERMNVFETLSQAARQWPSRPAIIDATGTLDYQSLWREIESLRVLLARLDVCEGQGVGVRARNGRAFVIGALAALGCGATVMPIPHQLKSDELTDMLARAPLGFILDDGCGTGQAGKAARGMELPGGIGLRFTRLDGPSVPLAPGFEDAAFVRFTSGTTGTAKGVV